MKLHNSVGIYLIPNHYDFHFTVIAQEKMPNHLVPLLEHAVAKPKKRTHHFCKYESIRILITYRTYQKLF